LADTNVVVHKLRKMDKRAIVDRENNFMSVIHSIKYSRLQFDVIPEEESKVHDARWQ